MRDYWIAAIIEDDKGQKNHYQFDSEDELRYFLAIHDDFRLIRATECGDRY